MPIGDSGEEIALFRAVAAKAGGRFREIVILDTREGSVERFNDRGAGEQDPWHGQVREIVEQGGGSQLLESMYDDLIGGLLTRPSASVIHSCKGAIEETYANMEGALAQEPAEPTP